MPFRACLLALAASLIAAGSTAAAPVIFFGEDVNTAGDFVRPPPVQSTAARDAFFGHLSGVATESFEAFPLGDEGQRVVTFPGAGSATVSGGIISDGEIATGRYPSSGLQFLDGEVPIRMAFSSPIAAFGFYGTDVGDFGRQLALQLTALSGETVRLAVPTTTGIDGSTSGSIFYFGFYDLTDTYTSLYFDNGDDADIFGMDDFSIASPRQVVPSPIPEPAVWSLMIAGFALVGSALRRRAAIA